MSGQIVHHHADQVGGRVMNISQIAHAKSEVASGSMLCDLHMAPGSVRIEKHEQIGGAVTPIFVIVTFGLAWRRRDGLIRQSAGLGFRRSKSPDAMDRALRRKGPAHLPCERHRCRRLAECTTYPSAMALDRLRPGVGVLFRATILRAPSA